MLKARTLHIVTLCLIIALILLNILFAVSFWWYVCVLVLWFLMMAYVSFNMKLNFFLKSFTGNPKMKAKKIAITFDDGPNPKYTPEVLKLLKAYNAKATFFCIGKHVESHPELLKSIAQEGHQIGNHSFSHKTTIDFNSANKWIEELEKTDEAIEAVVQMKPTCFRPPYGVTTPQLAKAIKKTGHTVVGWNLRSFDTVIKNPRWIVNKLIKGIQSGAIILLHDKQSNCIPVLECLLQHCNHENYKLVTVNELFNDV